MRARKWILLAVLAVALSAVANAQLPGAIWTSTSNGTTVNGNIYGMKEDVYLNGGPRNCKGSGLPDGEYYFQVTDPSGSELLSKDDLDKRKVAVSGGLITGYLGGTHATGTSSCPGGITVALAPFETTRNKGGEYKVWLTPVDKYQSDSGTFGFIAAWSKTDNFKVRERDVEPPLTGEISGMKWYDANTNGTKQSDEPAIEGWKIWNKTDNSYACTDKDGKYYFPGRPEEKFSIEEVFPTPPPIWLPTTPTSGDVITDSKGDGKGPDFGNVCLGPGGGKTLGFWSNKNGEATLSKIQNWLGVLSGLNLRNAAGGDFDPVSYAAFRTWLLGANATNMAYMLSAQLAAMQLNVLAGFVNGGALIFAPGTKSANASGFASVNAIIAEANAELGMHATAYAGDSWRSYQEALKNALDKANNNENFVQPGPCPLPKEGYCP